MIIPLPEASDYIEKKEARQSRARGGTGFSSFSVEKGAFGDEELEMMLLESLTRESDLTPRLQAFVRILLTADRAFDREEIKAALHQQGIGRNLGQTGRYLSNISQFITKKSNPHLRQVIGFDGGDSSGQQKDNYRVVSDYRDLLAEVLNSAVG